MRRPPATRSATSARASSSGLEKVRAARKDRQSEPRGVPGPLEGIGRPSTMSMPCSRSASASCGSPDLPGSSSSATVFALAASRPGKAWRMGDWSRRSPRPSTRARFRPRALCWLSWASRRRSPPGSRWNSAAWTTSGQPHSARHTRSPIAPCSSPSPIAARTSARSACSLCCSCSRGVKGGTGVGPASRRAASSSRRASSGKGVIAYSTGPQAISAASQRAFANGHRTKVGAPARAVTSAARPAWSSSGSKRSRSITSRSTCSPASSASARSVPSASASRPNSAPQAASNSPRRPAAGLTNNPAWAACGWAGWGMVISLTRK